MDVNVVVDTLTGDLGACLGNPQQWLRSIGAVDLWLGEPSDWWAGRIVVSEKTYRAWQPDQAWLLPPSLRDWLPEGSSFTF